ncbi:MAG: alpha-L-fucosidase, partial [Verrucomicrobia bacterium]|nr:alpha-L-fucosidase [Verrucomicrobiota bacterium]
MKKMTAIIAMALTMWVAASGGEAPGRPKDFKPFAYEPSTEQLAEQFSASQMERAEAELQEIQAVNDKGPWKPSWESLDRHQAPEWFLDAKLGVMLNWGMHSVPAWDRNRGGAMYPDAYGCEMYRDSIVMPHHAKFWGADFQWDDFLPLFKAERYDPNALVSLFEEAGARYLITMSKHHDGVAWWDSQWTRRNTVQMGPKKDLLTPLMAAAKKRDFKVVLYFCYEEWATAMLGADDKPCYRIWNWGSYAGLHPLTPESRRRVSGNIPVKNYYEHYMAPLVKEMIDHFDPDGLWMDGEWATPAETLRSRELAAYFYNKVEGRKEVTINDRLGQGTRDKHGDYFASEYNSTQSYTHPWEENQGISQSFAYNYEDNEESLGPPARLIHKFITIVSKNGNLVIIGGPDASGVYPQNVVRRFKALGAWLKVNGEAIYATRILPPYQEGSTSYTRSKDGRFAYAICKEWPGKSLTLMGVRAEDNARITMLGIAEPLAWQQNDQGWTIAIPEALQDEKARPCQHAWAIKIPMQPKVVITRKNFAAPVALSAWGLCDRVVYTLDASEPTASSTVYAGPVALPGGVTTPFKARCVRRGKLVGQTAFAQFQGSPPVPPKPDVYLDTLEPVSFKTGWQAAGVNTWRKVNCHGQPLKVCGDTFARGLGMHANGEAVFPVKPEYKQWVCRVGIDDAAGNQGSVVVKIFLDDRLICQTPVLSGGIGLWNVNASLEGATDKSRLKILIEDNGDGIQGDNVDLVDAGFVAQPGQAQLNYYNAPPEAVEAWRQWKFGMHVQWNPSVLRGGEISWSRHGAGAALHQGAGLDPEYDSYYKQFKAEKFNARELCTILKDAGMRFSTFCNKHHDGFCMWDTQLSDYKSTSPECPAGRDFTREWAEACRATGLKYAVYPSQPDWIDTDYLRSPEAHARYIQRLHGWIRELCANYGAVDAIEFDGLGGLACNWDSQNLFKMIRELQPNVVINSRCGAYDVKDWPAHVFMPHSVEATRNLPFTRGFPGDFDTPESWHGGMEIGRPQFDRPWETCSPLQKGQWQYNGNREFMSATEVLQLLINIVGRDGNLMMCVGIRPDGTFDERHVAVLKEVGQWLRKYGETIYETRGGPYFPTTHGVATYHGNKIFLHLLQWPGDKLVLPPIQRKLVRNAVLAGGMAEVTQDEKGAISVSVSKEHRRDIDTIVALTLDAPAKGAKPGRFALGSLATGKKVRASNVYSGQPY